MHLLGSFTAKENAITAGDYILILTDPSGQEHHRIDAAAIPRGVPLREAAQDWCHQNGHTLKIDWSTLTSDL